MLGCFRLFSAQSSAQGESGLDPNPIPPAHPADLYHAHTYSYLLSAPFAHRYMFTHSDLRTNPYSEASASHCYPHAHCDCHSGAYADTYSGACSQHAHR